MGIREEFEEAFNVTFGKEFLEFPQAKKEAMQIALAGARWMAERCAELEDKRSCCGNSNSGKRIRQLYSELGG